MKIFDFFINIFSIIFLHPIEFAKTKKKNTYRENKSRTFIKFSLDFLTLMISSLKEKKQEFSVNIFFVQYIFKNQVNFQIETKKITKQAKHLYSNKCYFSYLFPNHTQTSNTEPNKCKCSFPLQMNTHTHTYKQTRIHTHTHIHTETLLDRTRPFLLELSTKNKNTDD